MSSPISPSLPTNPPPSPEPNQEPEPKKKESTEGKVKILPGGWPNIHFGD